MFWGGVTIFLIVDLNSRANTNFICLEVTQSCKKKLTIHIPHFDAFKNSFHSSNLQQNYYFMLWILDHTFSSSQTNDTATNLKILRQLREFASQGCLEAKVSAI